MWKRPAAVIPFLPKSSKQSIYIKRKLEKTGIADLILVDTGLVLFCEHLRMSQGFTVYQTVCSNKSPGNVSTITK